MPTFQDYINTVTSSVAQRILKIELLDSNENVIDTLTPNILGGEIQLSSDSGARRNVNINLKNSDGSYIPDPNGNFWVNSKFRVWTGYKVNGEDYFWSRGIFVSGEPDINSNTSEQTVNLALDDKFLLLNGTLGGELENTYIIQRGEVITEALTDLLSVAGEVKPPIIEDVDNNILLADSNYWEQGTFNTSTGAKSASANWIRNEELYNIVGGKSYSITFNEAYQVDIFEYKAGGVFNLRKGVQTTSPYTWTTHADTLYFNVTFRNDAGTAINTSEITTIDPYINNIYTIFTIVAEVGETYSDLIEKLASQLNYTYYFDENGYFRFEKPVYSEVEGFGYDTKPSVWNFNTETIHYLGSSRKLEYSKIHNFIKVIGDNVNGKTYIATAEDTNSDVGTTKIGKKVKVIKDELIYSDGLAQQRANYELKKYTSLAESVSMKCIPIDIINSDNIITLDDENNGTDGERYLVKSVSFPLLNDGEQSMNVWRIREIN